MNDVIIGAIRALAQTLAGALATFLFDNYAVEIDSTQLMLILVAVFTVVYRQIITWLATYWPVLEVLNGWKIAPKYQNVIQVNEVNPKGGNA